MKSLFIFYDWICVRKLLKLSKVFSCGLLVFFIPSLILTSEKNVSKQKNLSDVIDYRVYKKRLLDQNESEKTLLLLRIRNSENALLIQDGKERISKVMRFEHAESCRKERELWADFEKKKEQLQKIAVENLDPVHKQAIDFECGH